MKRGSQRRHGVTLTRMGPGTSEVFIGSCPFNYCCCAEISFICHYWFSFLAPMTMCRVGGGGVMMRLARNSN